MTWHNHLEDRERCNARRREIADLSQPASGHLRTGRREETLCANKAARGSGVAAPSILESQAFAFEARLALVASRPPPLTINIQIFSHNQFQHEISGVKGQQEDTPAA
jgi:hypothetical protein